LTRAASFSAATRAEAEALAKPYIQKHPVCRVIVTVPSQRAPTVWIVTVEYENKVLDDFSRRLREAAR
jgi:hypothetical protein